MKKLITYKRNGKIIEDAEVIEEFDSMNKTYRCYWVRNDNLIVTDHQVLKTSTKQIY